MGQASFRAYGLGIQAPFELPVDETAHPGGGPTINIRLCRPAEVAEAFSGGGGAPEWQATVVNGCHLRLQRGREGDHLLSFGRRACFHLGRDCDLLLCGPSAPTELDWQRFLIETVLSCASSICGFEALHASAVRTKGGLAVFVGARGAGKSALAAQLVARGHTLVCDDVLALSEFEAAVLAHPGPPFIALQAGTGLEPGEPLGAPAEDGTVWVRVGRDPVAPECPAAIFILEPHRSLGSHPIREDVRPRRLLPHTLALDRSPDRALSRLELLQRLSVATPLHSLGGRDPVVQADAVERALAHGRLDRADQPRTDRVPVA